MPPTLPLGFMELVDTGSTLSLLVYSGASFEDSPSYYTIYEMLSSDVKFGNPSVLRVLNTLITI